MKVVWKAVFGGGMLMLGILILARGAFLPADTIQGKLVVALGGLLVVGPYVLTWYHFHYRLEDSTQKTEEQGREHEVEDAKHGEKVVD